MGKPDTSHLLRHAYRDNGRVRHRTIANLSRCSTEGIEAIRLALQHKDDLAQLARLFRLRHPDGKAQLFLYDVTSSCLKGTENELAAFGHNRDGKKGKRQIVVGLLCDETGWPVSVEVFAGNTSDTFTFASQVRKVADRFGGGAVTYALRALNMRLWEISPWDAENIEKRIRSGRLPERQPVAERLLHYDRESQRYVPEKNGTLVATYMTLIELLSPTNKRAGSEGRERYLENRAEIRQSRANLVELDLARGGRRLPMQTELPRGDCYALVRRDWRL